MYDVAMMKLKDVIGQHAFISLPSPDIPDIVRPVCLPEPGLVFSNLDINEPKYTQYLEKPNSWFGPIFDSGMQMKKFSSASQNQRLAQTSY